MKPLLLWASKGIKVFLSFVSRLNRRRQAEEKEMRSRSAISLLVIACLFTLAACSHHVPESGGKTVKMTVPGLATG